MELSDAKEYGAIYAAFRQAMKEHRAEDAERHARDLVGLAERAWDESGELIRALDVLAMALRHSKPQRDPASLAEQLALHERALQITAALRGPDHFENALALHKVGLDLWGLDRREEALTVFRRGLALSKGTEEGDRLYFTTRELRSCLGALLVELHRPPEAIPLLEREAQLADADGADATRMVAHRMLGRALLDAGRGEEASRSLWVALGIAESLDPSNARLIEELRAWLAELLPSPR